VVEIAVVHPVVGSTTVSIFVPHPDVVVVVVVVAILGFGPSMSRPRDKGRGCGNVLLMIPFRLIGADVTRGSVPPFGVVLLLVWLLLRLLPRPSGLGGSKNSLLDDEGKTGLVVTFHGSLPLLL
jgi:hypothetical protein